MKKIIKTHSGKILLSILFIFLIILFGWERRYFHIGESIDSEIFSHYGDFIGGVLAFVSVILLIKTHKEQQELSRLNNKEAELQRFNALFFELLRLYKTECLSLDTYSKEPFFDYQKRVLHRSYQNTNNYKSNINVAINHWRVLYTKQPRIGTCFRILYRVYDLIDHSEVDDNIKKEYLKIVRAQLTDSEMLFLRYNTMTQDGKKFIDYINKYNILKHLPAFDLLEFKDWWQGLNELERMGINTLYKNTKRIITKAIENKEKPTRSFERKSNSKYDYAIRIEANQVVICLTIYKSNDLNTLFEFNAFDKIQDSKRIQALLDCFMKEMFLYSNFSRMNNVNDLTFFSPQPKDCTDRVVIETGIKSQSNIKLREVFRNDPEALKSQQIK